jgi:hypothetical protein
VKVEEEDMKRVTGALVVFAALGGCTATQQESGVGKRVTYDYRQQLPGSSDPIWAQNNRAMMYANGQMAPYTRIGPSGTLPQGTQFASAAGANQQLAVTQPAATLPTLTTEKTSTATKPAATDQAGTVTKPASQSATTSDKPVKDEVPSDPAALSNTIAATIAKSDAKTAEILGGAPPADSSTVVKPKDAALPRSPLPRSPSAASKDTTPTTAVRPKSDMLVSASYIPSKTETLELRPSAPPMRIINNKRVTLNYRINDIGPSGVSGIDVWVTRDSRVWKKLDVGTQTHPPCVVEVSDEGLYGFTLLARNGLGLGKSPPQPGEPPQVWVDVDLTKPVVRLVGAEPNNNGKPEIVIRWNASDKNLGPKPITLSYSDKNKGPWTPLAVNLENTGRYVWQVPAGATGRFHVRVEATDLAGNLGFAQALEPVLIDMSQPTISILNVESGK